MSEADPFDVFSAVVDAIGRRPSRTPYTFRGTSLKVRKMVSRTATRTVLIKVPSSPPYLTFLEGPFSLPYVPFRSTEL